MKSIIRLLAAAGLMLCCILQTDAQVTGGNTGQGPYISLGATFTLGTGTGACATTTTLVGGPTAGSFVCTGTAGAATMVINLPPAPHWWVCRGYDANATTQTVLTQVAPVSTTSCKISGNVTATNDVVGFVAVGF